MQPSSSSTRPSSVSASPVGSPVKSSLPRTEADLLFFSILDSYNRVTPGLSSSATSTPSPSGQKKKRRNRNKRRNN